MAKLRIIGHHELIELPQDVAKRVEKQWLDSKVSKDARISAGRFRFVKGDIKAIILEEEAGGPTQHDSKVTQFFEWRDAEVKLAPELKAKHSWEHFSLFHWGIFLKPAPLDMRPHFEKLATAYYAKNPERARASPMLFYEVLGMDKANAKPIHESALRVIESVEKNEQGILYKRDQYQAKVAQRDTEEATALQKVADDTKQFDTLSTHDTGPTDQEDTEITARQPVDYPF